MGGSDLPKQEEQLGEGVVDMFPYNFSQNGLVAYKDGKVLEIQTISKFLGEDNIKRIVNWVLKYLADVDIPVKVSKGQEWAFSSGCARDNARSQNLTLICSPRSLSLSHSLSPHMTERNIYWIP